MHWYLENVYKLKMKAPDTFYVPSKKLIDQLKIGDIVKLIFSTEEGKDGFSGERMWVEITERNGGNFKGRLTNEPFIIENLKIGHEIVFGLEHICEMEYEDPWAEELDAYLDTKVLVSNDVLERNEFNFLWRDKAEEHEDSGWTVISGYEGGDGLNNPDQFQYLSIGVILNIDAAILSFIQEEPPSAYERNKEGKFEKTADYVREPYLES